MSGTIVVWVLVAYVSSGAGGGPVVVDNIATKQNCEALARVIEATNIGNWTGIKCIAVRKVQT